MIDATKGYKIAVVALVFAFIGWVLPGTITNNFYNIFNISGVDNTSLNLKVNKSGDSMTGILNMTGNNINSVNVINITNGINIISKVYNSTYTINTTATETGVLTINVSNAVGANNDTLVYLNGHSNANFSDVFFTQNNVTIPFYHTETNLSMFYVNVTSLTYPVVLNYGNLSINNIGDGNTTFDIFADGTTLEKFNTTGVTLSGGNISIAANINGGNYLTTKTKINRPSVAVYDLTVPAFYSVEGFTTTSDLQNEANTNQIIYYAAGDNNFYSEYHDGIGSSSANIGARTATEHVQKLLWRNTSTETKFYIDDIEKTSPGANFPTTTPMHFSISAHDSFNVANILVDNLLIYKYSNGKFNTWGSEIVTTTPTTGQLYCVFVNAAGSVQATLGAC